ncbi:MAG TPA: NUDIX hydrolase [Chlamydiales bacterium]|nr:NUDIX hydrolase [Chlamydiales bacterium]
MKKAAIICLFTKDRKNILVVKRSDVPVWVLPGGGIDDNETAEKAACRELFEETGVKGVITRKVATYYPVNCLSQETHLFECSHESGIPSIQEETVDVAFFSIDSLPQPFFFLHKEWIFDALKNNSAPIEQKLTQLSWLKVFVYIIRHPYLMCRYFLSRAGIPINSKPSYNRDNKIG